LARNCTLGFRLRTGELLLKLQDAPVLNFQLTFGASPACWLFRTLTRAASKLGKQPLHASIGIEDVSKNAGGFGNGGDVWTAVLKRQRLIGRLQASEVAANLCQILLAAPGWTIDWSSCPVTTFRGARPLDSADLLAERGVLPFVNGQIRMLKKLLNLAQVATGFQVELRSCRRPDVRQSEPRQTVAFRELLEVPVECFRCDTGCDELTSAIRAPGAIQEELRAFRRIEYGSQRLRELPQKLNQLDYAIWFRATRCNCLCRLPARALSQVQ
jgi:hypothetical protein